MRLNKGQSILLSHAILVGFSIFLVYAISTTFVTLKNDYQKFIGGNEVKQLCFMINGAVNKIHSDSDYNLTGNTLLGSIDMRIPSRIAGANYRVKFANQSVIVESLDAKFNETCIMALNATYNGSTTGGLTKLIYIKDTNGRDWIDMVRV